MEMISVIYLFIYLLSRHAEMMDSSLSLFAETMAKNLICSILFILFTLHLYATFPGVYHIVPGVHHNNIE